MLDWRGVCQRPPPLRWWGDMERKTIFLFLYWAFICVCVGGVVGFAFGMSFTCTDYVGAALRYNKTAWLLWEEGYTQPALFNMLFAEENCQNYRKHRLELVFGRKEYDKICETINDGFNKLLKENLDAVGDYMELWTQ